VHTGAANVDAVAELKAEPCAMTSDVLVSAEQVSKKFCRSLKLSLWYGVRDIVSELNPLSEGAAESSLRQNEFWAVRNVSFQLRRGDCLGLIGRNGAGKTTLLKMLNGLIRPDTGRITIRGRVGALIALGAGFNPLLTGRENIYVNGSVLGLKKAEIDRHFDEIVAFSEVGEFIDTPVQNYSSGMQVRLGFSVAVKLIRPDVLILDEVVAVGDEGFRAKCYRVIGDLLGSCAVIFVSHSMPMIYRLSTQVLVLANGEAMFSGDPIQGIDSYFRSIEAGDQVVRRSLGTGDATIDRLSLEDEQGNSTDVCQSGRPFRLSIDLTVSTEYPEYDISLTFMSRAQELVAQCHSTANRHRCQHDGRRHRHVIAFDAQLLNPGSYWLNIAVFDRSGTRHLCWEFAAMKFTVVGEFIGSAPVQILGAWRTAPVPLAGLHDPAPQLGVLPKARL
jgi:lipopolysaccharide transport system ATP-binding protein